MNPFPIASSALRAWAYDKATGRLQLVFADGSRYSYANVPAKLVEQLLTSQSPGKFFNVRIRNSFAHCHDGTPLS